MNVRGNSQGGQATIMSRRRQRQARLRRWAGLSIGVHLLIGALLIPKLNRAPELETHIVTEVDLVDQEPEAPRITKRPGPRLKQPLRKKPRRKRAARRRSRTRTPVKLARPAKVQREDPAESELLVMREPEISLDEPEPAPPPRKNRFSSFWSQGRRPAPAPVSRERLDNMEVNRYADGGRVLRSTGGAPNKAASGLLDLAAGKLGMKSGAQACNPYRNWRGAGQRDLVLIVDTSGSVVRARRAPASLVCAAGAALAALKRGFSVTVINFSTTTQQYGPTDNIGVVYKALSTFQAQGTMLPRLGKLKLSGHNPRDYVLISDAAIQNLEQVIPGYGKVLRSNPRNRALLYYLGGGNHKDMDPAKALDMIRRTGFRAEQVNGRQADS